MGGITLTRSEFLVLMDAVQAPGVVGLDAGELVPANTGEHKALVAEGIQRLSERGALRVESGVNVLDTDWNQVRAALLDWLQRHLVTR